MMIDPLVGQGPTKTRGALVLEVLQQDFRRTSAAFMQQFGTYLAMTLLRGKSGGKEFNY